MGEKLIDDLARALAQPMPRRRALRLVGISIVAVTVPGMRPRIAQGTPRLARAGECGADERACPRVVNLGSGPDLCCGSPARRYGCEGTIFDPVCVDLCGGPNDVPCPSQRKDSDGYSYFQCCRKPDRCVDGDCVPNCALQGKTQCGKQCCERGQECTNWRFSNHPQSKLRRTCLKKCRTIERRCGIAIEERCCPKDQVCCGDTEFKVCCPLDYVCVTVPQESGKSRKACGPKCKPGQKRCRLRCCNEITFETLPSGFKHCRCA